MDTMESLPVSPLPLKSVNMYVFGNVVRSNSPTMALCVLTPTPCGWKSRSTVHDRLQHDYVQGETVDELVDWLRHDLHRPLIISDRQEALERLATEWSSTSWKTFLWGNPSHPDDVRAEEVLRHLEHGW